jgi:hypothetical protein
VLIQGSLVMQGGAKRSTTEGKREGKKREGKREGRKRRAKRARGVDTCLKMRRSSKRSSSRR